MQPRPAPATMCGVADKKPQKNQYVDNGWPAAERGRPRGQRARCRPHGRTFPVRRADVPAACRGPALHASGAPYDQPVVGDRPAPIGCRTWTTRARPTWSTSPPRTPPGAPPSRRACFGPGPTSSSHDHDRRLAQGRRAGDRPDRRHPRRQAHQRPHPAVPPTRADRGRRRIRGRHDGRPHHRHGAHHRPHRASRWRR